MWLNTVFECTLESLKYGSHTTPIGMGSAAPAAVVALPRSGDPHFPKGVNGATIKKPRQKNKTTTITKKPRQNKKQQRNQKRTKSNKEAKTEELNSSNKGTKTEQENSHAE